MAARPPSGTVTFLFTDIQDSTRLWEEAPVDMATALQVHDTILRGAIERHGGYVFATCGDAFCAAFSTAATAAAAAIESQQELCADDTIAFGVRMGLHTGEANNRDRNYFGSEVNRAGDLSASLGRPIEFPEEMIPAVSAVVEATCTDAVREIGLIKGVAETAPDATATERLMAQAGRSIPR